MKLGTSDEQSWTCRQPHPSVFNPAGFGIVRILLNASFDSASPSDSSSVLDTSSSYHGDFLQEMFI